MPKPPPLQPDAISPGKPDSPPIGKRLLITAGPTHEPIDAVRFIGNRSSGRLGMALAEAAAARGWSVTLLLGPTPIETTDTRVHTERFQTTAELQALLHQHFPRCDTLIMAAAVADYRPATSTNQAPLSQTKITRASGKLTLELESTPDLLALCSGQRTPGQTLVGFALEPRDRMLPSAQSKLERKGLDAIVANPLETMDAPTIEATLLRRSGAPVSTNGPIPKEQFARWLLDQIEALTLAGASSESARPHALPRPT